MAKKARRVSQSAPSQNWSWMPTCIFDRGMSEVESKVIIYIARHTQGDPKPIINYEHITLDEFQYGLKRKDGTRVDHGTGLSRPSVIKGIRKALEHGHILVMEDDTDAARVIKKYS